MEHGFWTEPTPQGEIAAADRAAKLYERRHNMKRVVVTVVVVSFLALAGVLSRAPVPSDSVAYAQASDAAIVAEIAKLKAMVADLETKVQSKQIVMGPTGRGKAMKMLEDVSKMLLELYSMGSD